ncbi:MAG TPA: protein kinase [Blastocatellia bacterium]|nr:protein kinase [Blastocatellia bacterium]
MSSRRIGTYQITDYIGSGGFGSVFKAEDTNTPGRVVAVKELHKKHTRNQQIKQRFFQEAVAMARLDHPNLPRLYTFGEDNGSYYLVMEFISGKLLSDEIHDGGPLRPDRAVAVLTQMVDALSYAHRNGIIHRDLKPDNVILVGDGGSLKIKVLDFGIARMVGGESLTLAGEGFGTPTYMSPERISGAGGDDPRMDLYSAGIVLYEMLAGKAPFESKATDPALYWAEMRDLHHTEPIPALGTLGVPAQLERVATKATAKRLEDRYQTADEMLADLKSLSGITRDPATILVNTSRLCLSTAPGAAEVYVDDALHGTSDARGKILIDGLNAGLHNVRVLKEGYNEYRINVALEDGRQTDLQVALSARATVAMPVAENTAAGGFETLRLQGADEAQTAVLVVESLPAGSAVFVGSNLVGQAGEDGRATIRLSPGSHELRATAPSGATGTSVVSVAAEDTGALKTMTLALASANATSSSFATTRKPTGRGRQIAAAAVVILLLALATAAYFVLRGPGRNRTQVDSVTVASSAPDQTASSAGQALPGQQPQSNADQQAVDEKKKAAEESKRAAQDAAAIEAEKKAEAKSKDKAESKNAPAQPATPIAPPIVAPTPPDGLPEPEHRSANPGRDGCLVVTVKDAEGTPVQGVMVAVADADGGAASLHNGRTGPKGRWHDCGFTPGHRVRITVRGQRGAMLGSQQAVVVPGTNFIEMRGEQTLDEGRPQMGPGRRRPLFKRP